MPPAPPAPPAFPAAFPAPEPGGLPAYPAPGLPSAAPFPAASAAPPPSPTTFPVPPPEPSVTEALRAPVTALPFDAGKLRPAGAPGSKVPPGVTKPPFGTTQPPYEPPAKSKLGLYIGIGVVAALIFAAVAVVVEARLERIKASELEQQEELARHITEQRLKEAEQSSKEQQEASRKEMELAIAQAKRDAEEEARKVLQAQEDASRAAKQPGTVVIVTDPSGAYVSVDGAPPVMTPAHLGNLAVGSHHFHITRQGYDPADVDGDVKAGQTTTLDTVTLSSIYGSAEFASTPDGLDFSVKPAGDLLAKVVASGTTPMVLPRLPHGDYVATFHRPGCHDHFENFTVAAGERVAVATAYQDGSLELSSDPSGASVDKDGSFIGTTPLVLHNLTPKVASFELNLPGYDVTPVSCDIPEGTTLKYSAQLLRKDRVFTVAEVKTAPVKLEGSMPQLSSDQREAGGTAVLSFVVRRDGSVGYIEVVRTTDDVIARRCQNTVEGWKYRPATAPDDRIVDARIEVSFKFPPGS